MKNMYRTSYDDMARNREARLKNTNSNMIFLCLLILLLGEIAVALGGGKIVFFFSDLCTLEL